MSELQEEHGTRSVSFEMLGPPHNSKLLFEAHLLREAYGTMDAVCAATAEGISETLDSLVRDRPTLANEIASIGIPVLLDSGELIRGPEVIVPGHTDSEPVTPENLERWVDAGWVDLRIDNCRRWRDRMIAIRDEFEGLPQSDTSSRYVRNRRFWEESDKLQPGKVVAWILSTEERGDRHKH